MVYTEIDRVTVESFSYSMVNGRKMVAIIFDVEFIQYDSDEIYEDELLLVRHELRVDSPVWETVYDLSNNILYELFHTYPSMLIDPDTPITYPADVWDSLRRYFEEAVI